MASRHTRTRKEAVVEEMAVRNVFRLLLHLMAMGSIGAMWYMAYYAITHADPHAGEWATGACFYSLAVLIIVGWLHLWDND
jgi:hypothetical protein